MRVQAPDGYVILKKDDWYYPARTFGKDRIGLFYFRDRPTPIHMRQNSQAVDFCIRDMNKQVSSYKVRELTDWSGFTIPLQ